MKILERNNRNVSKKRVLHVAPLTPEDVTDEYVAWLNDPQINRYLEVRHNLPITKEDVVSFVGRCQADRRPHWGIFDGKRHIGNVSCSAYDLRARWIDISFLVGNKDYWGSGVATSAVAGVVDYLFNKQHFHKIQGGSYSLNLGSIRIFKKLGFIQEACLRDQGVLDGQYVDIVKYGLLKKDWGTNGLEQLTVQPLSWSFF